MFRYHVLKADRNKYRPEQNLQALGQSIEQGEAVAGKALPVSALLNMSELVLHAHALR